MNDFIILHALPDNAEAAVYPAHFTQVVTRSGITTIYFIGGDNFRYKESLQEIIALTREMKADLPRVRRPAPSHMGAVKSKHGRVT